MGELSDALIVGIIFIGAPMVVMHYAVQWKRARSLSADDEQLLDSLQEKARRLDARLSSVERILDAENPNWRKEF